MPARSAACCVDGRLLPIGAAKVAGSEYDFTEPPPDRSRRLDTAFGDVQRDAARPVGGDPVRGRRDAALAVWADASFDWWQVYTGDTLPVTRHRRAVAVEPMTCPPDAFRSGRDLIVLAPGQTWSGSLGHPAARQTGPS